jgi:glutamate---cysteine ligase / carboxylate-amine ligase
MTRRRPGYPGPVPDRTTLGVEEEYLLVDGEGLPVARSAQVLAKARGSGLGSADLQHELLEVQVEVATPVCSELAEVRDHLTSLRSGLAAAAAAAGCRLAPVGAAPLAPDDAGEVPVTDALRYRTLLEQAPALVEEQLINGMHVHVGVPDRAAGLAVLAAVRPWLPVLLALSANSPFWRGHDSGFASFRAVHFARWPVEGAPPVFASVEDYERRADDLLTTGAIADRGQLYWHARLSEHEPTVEVRVADVQLDAADAVVLAGLVRAIGHATLHGTAGSTADGHEPLPVELLRAATWAAARHGLDGDLFDPRERRPTPAAEVAGRMLAELGSTLRELGDLELVTTGVERVLRAGNGAARQRAALKKRGPAGVFDLVTGDVTPH